MVRPFSQGQSSVSGAVLIDSGHLLFCSGARKGASKHYSCSAEHCILHYRARKPHQTNSRIKRQTAANSRRLGKTSKAHAAASLDFG
eukprot:4634045-Amphidinium_carterae.2